MFQLLVTSLYSTYVTNPHQQKSKTNWTPSDEETGKQRK